VSALSVLFVGKDYKADLQLRLLNTERIEALDISLLPNETSR
jgi:hypothetical protein